MEFRDLKRQYAALKADIDRAVSRTLTSGSFIMGPDVKELESRLAAYAGTKHCLSCASGTDALVLALQAIGAGPGDAVFVPDFTFFATAEAVSRVGATPIFVDVLPETFNLDARDLEKAVTDLLHDGSLNPKAVIAVDLFGLPADYPAIREVCRRHGLVLIEDGAQGFGGSIDGRKACSFGDISATSFFPAKPLGCYGDGGAVFTDNDEWAELIASLRVHGKGADKYDNVRIGMNSRLDTIQAAVLKVKLDAFAAYELDAVRRAAAFYTDSLPQEVIVPRVPEGYSSSWAQYTIRLHDSGMRDALSRELRDNGIPCAVYYPKPLHKQTAFADLAGARDCPVASRLSTEVLSLPIHPYITEEELMGVCRVVCACVRG